MTTAYNIIETLARSPVGLTFGKVSQIVQYSDFTDGGSTAGTLTMKQQIPAGSLVLFTNVKVKTGFSGDTTAVMTVGKSSGEDEFSYGTSLNVLSAGTVNEQPEAGEAHISSAQSVYLVVTGASDFGLITAGKMLVEIFYVTVDKDFGRGYPLPSALNN